MISIHLASDHAGFNHKEFLKEKLQKLDYEVIDHGALSLDPTDDYPDFILPCAQAVATTLNSFGIILGGSGAGEAIAANRIPHVRAITFYGPWDDRGQKIITLAREHNDANILSLAARFLSEDEALSAVELFLSTPFSIDPRHLRRLAKIDPQ